MERARSGPMSFRFRVAPVMLSGLVVAWLASVGTGLYLSAGRSVVAILLAAAVGLVLSAAVVWWSVERNWRAPARRLAEQVDALIIDPAGDHRFDTSSDLATLAESLNGLSEVVRTQVALASALSLSDDSVNEVLGTPMTHSGLYEPPADPYDTPLPFRAGEFSTVDMIDRLDPHSFHWLESSPAEQRFLGWPLSELRRKSFPEIVHPEDVTQVYDGFRTALAKGEVHGLLFRVRTAAGKSRAVLMNVGARYAADRTVSHLRGHLTDVTAKLRAERDRRLRNRELTQVNERLRRTNRELEELKEKYRDLYQKSPAMYYSLDEGGTIVECNDTLLNVLGYRRGTLLGRSYETVLAPEHRSEFPAMLAEFLHRGNIEYESHWLKADGQRIDVWIKGSTVRGPDGRPTHTRNVAQDMTARHRLESELKEQHLRLTRANEDLSRSNRELAEFTHVVSHDLQEPLRTIDAFSAFLRRDFGERLDPKAQEYVGYIVEASHRMRDLIRDLLTLSRAGKVAGNLGPVDLEAQLSVVRVDLTGLIVAKRADVRASGPLPIVWGDPWRIGQLLTNLVANGLKYNDSPAPRVEIGMAAGREDDEGLVTIYVRDNGIGIDPRHHTRVFQLFRRLHGREEYDGTGAGLAICQKIVRALGGRIWVESEPGRGSTFLFTLRTAPSADDRPASNAGL